MLFKYFRDWTCPYKRAFWSLIGIDLPTLGLDFTVVYGWLFAYEEMIRLMGQGIGLMAGSLACVLTWYRIQHTRKLLKEK